jgi:pimeloyl-ACP methyl ester carboxylesterase
VSGRTVEVAGHRVAVAETGSGAPLLYLHGFTDVHGAGPDWQPFHQALAADRTLVAPAHPGCGDSEEREDVDTIEDFEFHYIEAMDRLGLDRVDVVGVCIGGWIAAELAVRHPERIGRLALVGACGLFVPGQPIADLFWQGQPANGADFGGLRELLFGDPDGEIARAMVPDAGQDTERELIRYRTYRLAGRIGFRPPYLHDRKLAGRLWRFGGAALVVHGADDRLVPPSHGEAYAAGLPAARLETVAGAGHCVHLERPAETAALVRDFLAG